LQAQIDAIQKSKRDQTLGQAAKAVSASLPTIRSPPSVKLRRILKGHFNKVTASHWSGDSTKLVSASQDGNLLVWNAVTNNKIQSIPLKSSYVMAVGMEQTKGNMVACGGLDNLCTIYSTITNARAVEMASHDGYLSCCRFLDERQIITASGDSTCILWDIASAKPVSTMSEHTADATFIALQPNERNVFVSGSVDATSKLWDIRTPTRAVQTFRGHAADINGVDFMPSHVHCFATAGLDNTVRSYDIRACNELAVYNTSGQRASTAATGEIPDDGFTSLSFSKSGRLIFCGHTDGSIVCFDTLASNTSSPTFVIQQAHERRISSCNVSPAGDAVCTSSWDGLVKIWA
jgi:guanine nucleotide-binding protein G(I)/G(S)/G(T) subunit beta-1